MEPLVIMLILVANAIVGVWQVGDSGVGLSPGVSHLLGVTFTWSWNPAGPSASRSIPGPKGCSSKGVACSGQQG